MKFVDAESAVRSLPLGWSKEDRGDGNQVIKGSSEGGRRKLREKRRKVAYRRMAIFRCRKLCGKRIAEREILCGLRREGRGVPREKEKKECPFSRLKTEELAFNRRRQGGHAKKKAPSVSTRKTSPGGNA